MARVKRGNVARKRRKKVLKRAKGFRGSLGKIFRPAKQAVYKALSYSTRDRRVRKREFRSLWITRINAGVRAHGMTYGKFMDGLRKAGIQLNRKVLSDLATRDGKAFDRLIELVSGSRSK